MNPMHILKLKQGITTFCNAHPGVARFFQDVTKVGIEEGTVIEISVQRPGEEKMVTNMKVQQSDLELFERIKQMKK